MSLQSLFVEQGQTYESVAEAVAGAFPGLDPTLFVRIDAARQPFPIEVAEVVAAAFGLQRGDLLAEVAFATRITGAAVRRPLPPRPVLGETIKSVAYAQTKQVVLG
jgi:hypothetical protein